MADKVGGSPEFSASCETSTKGRGLENRCASESKADVRMLLPSREGTKVCHLFLMIAPP